MQLDFNASGVSKMHGMPCCYSVSQTGFNTDFTYDTRIRKRPNTVTLQPSGKYVLPQGGG